MDIREKLRKDYERTLSIGVTEAIWRFIDVGPQSCEHAELDGVRFDLRKGARFKGKRVIPLGQCRCGYSSIIDCFDEDVTKEPKRLGVLARLASLLRKPG